MKTTPLIVNLSGRSGNIIVNPRQTASIPASARQRTAGVALLIVLGMLVLLSVVVIGFVTSVTTDLAASKAYANTTDTRMLADSALNVVISNIRKASTSGTLAWISQPGMVKTYNVSGSVVNSFKLYSSDQMVVAGSYDPNSGTDIPASNTWMNQPNLYTDLNSPVKIGSDVLFPVIDGNGMRTTTLTGSSALTYSTDGTIPQIEGFTSDPTKVGMAFNSASALSGSNNPVPMPVKWLYMLKDGTLLPASAVGSSKDVTLTGTSGVQPTAANPIVARIAFWTDDETCKVNINTASEGTFADAPVCNSQPFVADPGGLDPVGKSIFDPNQIFEWDLAQRAGVQREYQRYPGHPAQTCLSPILGDAVMKSLVLSGTGTSGVGYHTLTGTGWAKFAEAMAQFSPRVSNMNSSMTSGSDYSSRGGSYRGGGGDLTSSTKSLALNGGTNQTAIPTYGSPVSIDADRMYSTVDEMFFNYLRQNNSTPVTTTTNNVVLPASLLKKAEFFLTASSKAPEVNVFNLPRISIWPITKSDSTSLDDPDLSKSANIIKMTGFDKVIAFCSTVSGTAPTSGIGNRVPFYFTRFDPLSQTKDFGSRNSELYTYLQTLTGKSFPGFGAGTFAGKYGNDRDQILTEIFDYIRCLNLSDTSEDYIASGSIGWKSYTKISSVSVFDTSWKGITQQGQVVPIVIGSTRGIGRIATIGEMALIILKEDNRIDNTKDEAATVPSITLSGTSPYAGTWTFVSGSVSNQANVLVAETSGTGTVYKTPTPKTPPTTDYLVLSGTNTTTKYDPRKETKIQLALIPYLFSPMCGFSSFGHNIRLKFNTINITVKDKLGASFTPFASGTQPDLYDTGRVDVINQGELKIGGPIGCKSLVGVTRGGIPTNAGSPSDSIFPHGDCVISGTSGKVNGNAATGDTMTISGTVQMDIQSPAIASAPYNDPPAVIQSFTFVWPQTTVPIPSLSLAGTTYQGTYVAPQGAGTTESSNANTASPVTSGSNQKSGNSRLTGWGNYDTRILGGGSTGDAIRSLPLSGSTAAGIPLAGDFRIVASMSSIPQNFYQPIPKYTAGALSGSNTPFFDATKVRSYGFKSFVGDISWKDPKLGYLIENTSNIGSPNVPDGGINQHTYVPDGVSAVYNYLGKPGDWDNGPGLVVDGAYVNKPDEGTIRHYEAGSNFVDSTVAPYIGHAYSLEDAAFALPSLFAPNKQIASAGMFGSLPTGVLAQHPWQTLLFRPAKTYFPGDLTHPGAAVASSGGLSPGDGQIPYPPYSTIPDHLLLDLFWMPVVDPYPISEPFATAGKVNINYQIAPFTYIKRTTAMRAVLQSVKVTALNPMMKTATGGVFSSNYKSGGTYQSSATGDGGGIGVSVRRNIDLDSTLKEIDDLRFGVNKPFITASEICDVPLVPGDLPNNATVLPYNIGTEIKALSNASQYDTVLKKFWWGDPTNTSNSDAPAVPQFGHRLTGDNSLEHPYALIYPRLTTKSNTYTVHVRVQTLKKAQNTPVDAFKDGQDQVTGEFRGSFVIERYLDPATAGFYVNGDSTTNPVSMNATGAQLAPYRFRIISSKQFGQ